MSVNTSQEAFPIQDSLNIDDYSCLENDATSFSLQFATTAEVSEISEKVDKLDKKLTKITDILINLQKQMDVLVGNRSSVAAEYDHRMASASSGKLIILWGSKSINF